MEFGLSGTQEQLRDTVARFAADRIPLDAVRAVADGDGALGRELFGGLGELGVLGIATPEDHGGVGLGWLDACVVAEALGHCVAPVPFVATTALVPEAFLRAGSPTQQAEWLPRLAAGEIVAGAALSEWSGARLDAGVSARGGRLTGRALFVLDFDADHYLVADRDAGLHWVAAEAQGLSRTPLETVDRTRALGELRFDGVPAEPLPGSDRAVIERLLDVGRVLLAADTLGAAQAMLEKAVAYAQERRQFGRAIGSFQAVKHLCAEMAADLEPVRAFTWYAGHVLDGDPDEARSVACHLKAHASEVGRSVAKKSTEVHGGMGFTDLVGLHYWFKRVGFDRQLLGSPEFLRECAARAQGLVA